MRIRLKFIGVSLLLCVALVSLIVVGTETIQAYQQFTRRHQSLMESDVNTISPWMTIPYIARVYHMPEACLAQSLNITKPELEKSATLRSIADSYREPIETIIHAVQNAIRNYRQQQSVCATSSLIARAVSENQLSPVIAAGDGP